MVVESNKYQNIRDQIKNGDFLICSGNGPMSELIKKVTNSPYSHVAFIMWFHDRLMVLESVETIGVRMVPLSSYVQNYNNTNKPYDGDVFIGRHNTLSHLLLSQNTEKTTTLRIMQRALDLLGKKYGTKDLAKIALRLTVGLGRREDDDEYICSEYVAECLSPGGISFTNIGGFIVPKHIAEDPMVTVWSRISVR
ncbi:hypothetical protein DI243_12315 [Paenibacillus polymyxa]|nr:hypothetical protein RE92_24085 [Paenibacillus polymyxa]QOH62127.1 hypothetical protein DI243_12315 [Paenibacillus polymyxa]